MCGFTNEPNSKFCQECGNPFEKNLIVKSKEDSKKNLNESDIEPAPINGITIEFPYSSSSLFEFALKAAMEFKTFKKFRDNKNAIYRVTVNEDEIYKLDELLENLKGWRKRTVYVNGEKVTWESVFSYNWCYQKQKSSFKPTLYCFGYENDWEFNLWGCVRANMPFNEHSQWFTYGKWLNKEGDWEFDKERIKFELERNLFQFRYCPSVNIDLIKDIVIALPDVVNPNKNKNWKFVESYGEDGQGLVLTMTRYGFQEKVTLKGVCPNGKGYIKEIMNRMKLKLPSGL